MELIPLILIFAPAPGEPPALLIVTPATFPCSAFTTLGWLDCISTSAVTFCDP